MEARDRLKKRRRFVRRKRKVIHALGTLAFSALVATAALGVFMSVEPPPLADGGSLRSVAPVTLEAAPEPVARVAEGPAREVEEAKEQSPEEPVEREAARETPSESEAVVQQAAAQTAPEERAPEEQAVVQQAVAEPIPEEQMAGEQAVVSPPLAPPQTQPDASQSGTAVSAAVPSSTAMTLTVPAMGISGQAVGEGVDEATLHNGPGHAPGSGYPWIPGSNTYIAGHVLGYEGTGSYMNFAGLPNMTYGDQIFLTDANGTTYTYVVSEILQVSIYDTWVMGPTGRDQVSLQTCINPPAYDVRLVVRGDLMGTS